MIEHLFLFVNMQIAQKRPSRPGRFLWCSGLLWCQPSGDVPFGFI